MVSRVKVNKVQFVALQKKHKTDNAVGKALGISRQAVHQLRKKLGIKALKPDNRGRNAEIIKAYKDGLTGTAIAEKLGLSVSQTYRVINMALEKAQKAAEKSVKKAVKKAAAKSAPARCAPVRKTAAKKKKR